ncbi:SDR family NAD(P)-dependent oxidoreductase [Caballeronia sp. LZ032]|uniref:SDR family NAD(P)-dependent oxidoreductase n=1 Tax=Caballeronia sp. LZ032 TaxID=3038565 RepID=UPI002867026F|nr:SDR family NAD(P)-dependent oxidoreductase [Caballeronia sp. LZ032]MDR5877758.1 SDR family NAD(P)-dependent oxidoreductase [Caballeronia sp. LZ032]
MAICAHPPVALVTGASSGIGKSIALALLKEGYIVYGAARRADQLAPIQAAGGRVLYMDITDKAAVDAGVAQVLNEQPRIDVLINAAGYGQYGALEDIPMDDAHRQFDVNVFGTARLIQKVLPKMREQAASKIVNVTSVGGKIYTPMGGWYHASKFALEGYSDVLRLETRPFGIDVIVIEPGIIATG